MPIKFEITTKDGGTLHTAAKYCEDDIKITPKLQNKTVTENGTVSADEGYAGLGEVTVNVVDRTGWKCESVATGNVLDIAATQVNSIVDSSVFTFYCSSTAVGELTE